MTGSATIVAMCAGPESGDRSTVLCDINPRSCGSVSLPILSRTGVRAAAAMRSAICAGVGGSPSKLTAVSRTYGA